MTAFWTYISDLEFSKWLSLYIIIKSFSVKHKLQVFCPFCIFSPFFGAFLVGFNLPIFLWQFCSYPLPWCSGVTLPSSAPAIFLAPRKNLIKKRSPLFLAPSCSLFGAPWSFLCPQIFFSRLLNAHNKHVWIQFLEVCEIMSLIFLRRYKPTIFKTSAPSWSNNQFL